MSHSDNRKLLWPAYGCMRLARHSFCKTSMMKCQAWMQGCWMHHSFKYWQCTRFLCWKAAAWMCQVPAQLLTCGADRPVTAHRHCLGPTRFVTSKLHAASTAICTLALSKAPTLNNLTLHTACPGLQACCALGTQAPNTIFGLVDCRALTR